MKKYPLFVFMLLLLGTQVAFGQRDTLLEKGVATYTSSQNVYVKFASTEHINKGDTLFVEKNSQLLPALIVKDKSSTSCVCTSLLTEKVKISDAFVAKSIVDKKPKKAEPKKGDKIPAPIQDSLPKPTPVVVAPVQEDLEFKQKMKGRVSAASYSNFSGSDQTHRMRYAFTFQGNNIKNSRFSTDSYITYRHTLGDTAQIKLSDALKVYALSVKYDFNKKSNISLGRKINTRIASMGAVDGVQAEMGKKNLLLGALAGSRPDFADYSLNLNLLQVGVYVGHISSNLKKPQQTTLAFIEQHNGASIDRRFVYFQHSNTLTERLNFFGSLEVDLYKKVEEQVSNALSLTNMLLTLRYKASKKLNFSASYDNRKNIIYYESYKNYIDQLIDDETRQGLRFNANYHLAKQITWGANINARFQKSNINLSQNLNTYLNFTKIPWLNASASLTANILRTNYLDSKMYGMRVSKELVRGKLFGDFYVRMVDYNYKNYENRIIQEIAGVDLAWNITRTLAMHLYYEGTFGQQKTPFNRFNTKLIQRF